MGRVVENKENEVTCGKCRRILYYQNDEDPYPCSSCGWDHPTLKVDDVPSTFKYPISKKGG